MPSPKKHNLHSLPRVYGPEISPLRAYRVLRGLKQATLAVRGGLSQATYSRIERSEIKPTADQQHRIAAVLGVTVADLFPEPAAAAAPEKEADHEAGS